MACQLVDEDSSSTGINGSSRTDLPSPAFTPSLAPRATSTAASRSKEEFQVGFTCAFISPPKELTTDCPICLYILREPYQATCCGSTYCHSCIEHVRRGKKPCPKCRNNEFDVFPDRGLRNALYGFKVHCVYKEEGCNWTGELRYLENHLNVEPKLEQKFFGCEFLNLRCSTCEKSFPRHSLENHEMKACLGRHYTCEYCHDHSGRFEMVVANHWPECLYRELPCPNDCGVYPLKKDLQYHLENKCELRLPATAADGVTLGAIQSHIERTVKKQLEDFVANFLKQSVQGEVRKEVGKEADVIRELRDEVASLKHLRDENVRLFSEVERLRSEGEALAVSLEELKHHSCLVPITFTLDDYEGRYSRGDMGWTSPSFFTHLCGYQMCLLVDVGGDGKARGTYLSVFLNLTKGKFDSQLSWPFRGSVTVEMLNPEDEKLDRVEVIRYHESTPKATAGRVMEEGKMAKPWGKGRFIRHDELVAKGFVVNDSLQFRVSKVILDN